MYEMGGVWLLHATLGFKNYAMTTTMPKDVASSYASMAAASDEYLR